jgi:type VI protein secretion system component Hcp
MDAATPNIADKAANGVEFSKVEIDMVVNAGGNQSKTTMSYTFTKVYITSFVVSHQGTEGDDQNIFKEAITFDFATMIGKFTEVDDSGKTKGTSQFSWKVGKNTK